MGIHDRPIAPGVMQRSGTKWGCARRAGEGTLKGMIQFPLTEEQYAEVSRKLEAEQGIALTGSEGKITKMGVTAGYQYLDGVLRVTILDKPFFVSTEYCEEQLMKAVNSQLPAAQD